MACPVGVAVVVLGVAEGSVTLLVCSRIRPSMPATVDIKAMPKLPIKSLVWLRKLSSPESLAPKMNAWTIARINEISV